MVWRRVREAVGRWRRPKRQISFELTPEEQIAVLFLAQFGRATESSILQEVSARRWVEPHTITTALLNLQLKGLIRIAERHPETGVTYVPTPRAFEVHDILPREPVSSLQVYLTVDVPPQTPEQ